MSIRLFKKSDGGKRTRLTKIEVWILGILQHLSQYNQGVTQGDCIRN